MNKECEHEWVMEIPSGSVYCKKCLLRNPKSDFKPIDFKIPKNLEQINKQQWEDIAMEFFKFAKKHGANEGLGCFLSWAKENYLPPVKK